MAFLTRIHGLALQEASNGRQEGQDTLCARLAFDWHAGSESPLNEHATTIAIAKTPKATRLKTVLKRNALQMRLVSIILATNLNGALVPPLEMDPVTTVQCSTTPHLAAHRRLAPESKGLGFSQTRYTLPPTLTLRQLFYSCKPLMTGLASADAIGPQDHPEGNAVPAIISQNLARICSLSHSARHHFGIQGEGRALFSLQLVHDGRPPAWAESDWHCLQEALSAYLPSQIVSDRLIHEMQSGFIPLLYNLLCKQGNETRKQQNEHYRALRRNTAALDVKLATFEKEGVFFEVQQRLGRMEDKRADLFEELVFQTLLASDLGDSTNGPASGPIGQAPIRHCEKPSRRRPLLLLLVCSRGFPCFATRRLLRVLHQLQTLLHMNLEPHPETVPTLTSYATPYPRIRRQPEVHCFVDCNPAGIDILLTLATAPENPSDDANTATWGTSPEEMHSPEGDSQGSKSEGKVEQIPPYLPLRWVALKPSHIAQRPDLHSRLSWQLQPFTQRDEALLRRMKSSERSPQIRDLSSVLSAEAEALTALNGKLELQSLCN